MRLRRLVLRFGGAGALVVGGLLVASGSAAAEPAASVTSGWWNEAGTGAVTAPSTTSSGQLQVSSGLQGPLAFAAVSIAVPANLDPTTATATLTLVQVANSAVGTVAVSACPTTSAWSPGGDQPSSSAPGYDCSQGRQADGIDSDGQDSFAIPAGWASGSTIDVAIVPSPGTTAPFSVSYTAPTTQSAGLSGPPAPASASNPTSTGTGSAAPASSGSPQPSSGVSTPDTAAVAPAPPVAGSVTAGSATAAPVGASSAPSMFAPPPALASSPVAATPAPASGLPGGSPSIQASPARSGTPQSASPISGHPLVGPGRTGRILAISVLLLLGVVMFGLSAYPARIPRQLVPVGVAGRSIAPEAPVASHVGGIGRFAKPRTAPPRRL